MQLGSLNPAQRQAVDSGDGPVLIVAGPGTGKTKTLTTRIAYLLENQHVPADAVVALTFTRKAAGEMRARLAELVGEKRLPTVTTFHSLGQSLLSAHGHEPQLASPAELHQIVRELPKLAAFKGATPRELSLRISRAKTSMQPPSDAATRQLLENYQAALTAQKLEDFDDLLVKTYDLLRHHSSSRPHYRFVLVDEFQDTSELQYEILKLLGEGSNIFAIGDPNQSIYAFRSAGAEMFARFRADFPAVKTIELIDNYRSAAAVVNLANAIFPDSLQLVAHRSEVGEVEAMQTLNEYSEAAAVLRAVQTGIGGSDFLTAHAETTAAQPRDYAVLYRTHRAASALQRAFAESGLPYQIVGEDSPYLRPEVQTVITILRYLHNPADTKLPELKPLATSQLKILLEKVKITPGTSLGDVVTTLAELLELDESKLAQLQSTLVQFGAGKPGLAKALEHLDRISEGEFYDPTVNAVTLLTIHASKGLEFEHVYLIATEEGSLPKLTKKDEGDIAEERRLLYVAVTRAKQTLMMLYAKQRHSEPVEPSRFLQDIPEDILSRRLDPDLPALQKRLQKRNQKRAQTRLF